MSNKRKPYPLTKLGTTCLATTLLAPVLLVAALAGCTGWKIHTNPKASLLPILTPAPVVRVVRVVKFRGPVDEDWAIRLGEAFEEGDAVLMWIESGGGPVLETKILSHKIAFLKEKHGKPLWVFSDRFLASGAYWVACTADSILLSPFATTGSIGVFAVRIDRTVSDSLEGIKWWFFQSGRWKTMGSSHTPMTDEEAALYIAMIQDAYLQFLNHILEHRFDRFSGAMASVSGSVPDTSMVVDYMIILADGRLYPAREALAWGLVDAVDHFEDVVKALRGRGYRVETWKGEEILDLYPEE